MLVQLAALVASASTSATAVQGPAASETEAHAPGRWASVPAAVGLGPDSLVLSPGPLPPALLLGGVITEVQAGLGLAGGGSSGVVVLSHALDASAIPSAHHVKTTSASELVAGTLDEARLPQNAIDGTEVEDGSLTGDDVASASIPAGDLVDGAGSGLDADLLDGLDSSQLLAGGGPTGGTVGVLTTAFAYAWDDETEVWYPTGTSGTELNIVAAHKNLGAVTSAFGYAWSHDTKAWTPIGLSGSDEAILASGDNVGVVTSAFAYAWSAETRSWTQVGLSGTVVDFAAADGNFGVLTSAFAYAWSEETQTWYSTGSSGTELAIVPSGKNLGVLTSAFSYAWSHESKSWTSNGISGTELKIVGG